MIYWEWRVDKQSSAEEPAKKGGVSTTAWEKYKASSAIPYKKIHGWIIATSQQVQPLLAPFLATNSFHCSYHFSSYPSHLLFFFLSSQAQLTFITYTRTCTQGRADRNPHHSRREEEETRKTAKDDDARLTDNKGNLKWLYLLHTQWKTTWLSCLQWKQGLSLPEWWKMCTSHHVKGMDDMSRKHPSAQAWAASDRAVQTLPPPEKSNYKSGGNSPKFCSNAMKHMHLLFGRRSSS